MSQTRQVTTEQVESCLRAFAARYMERGRAEERDASGMSIRELSLAAPRLAKGLAHDLRSGRYRFGTWREHRAFIEKKERQLFVGPFTDMVVCAVLAERIQPAVDAYLPPQVHSYRKGYSSVTAVAAWQSYLRAYRAGTPDLRNRALYVLRRDIRKYGESIPVGESSPLWPSLRAALGGHHLEAWMDLVKRAVTPRVAYLDGRQGPAATVPTGSPLQPMMCNLLLAPLDKQLAALPNSFYARFGDDFLMASPDPGQSQQQRESWYNYIHACGLSAKEEDSRDFYLTGPARPSPAQPWQPASHIEFLGVRVTFRGHTALKGEHLRRFVTHLRQRLITTHQLLQQQQLPAPQRMRALCQVAARCVDPAHPLALPAAQLLRHHINDREHLRQLDYIIASTIAELLAQRRGPRAFRRWPYQKLRREGGLPSLVHVRDRSRR